jgi:hypothetical protein
MSVISDRLEQIEALRLASGGHSSWETGACVMEAVSYVAGEPFSDHPKCASRMLTSFLIGLNDRLGDDDRQLLKPYIVRLVGTNTGSADEQTRKWMLRDWLVHEYAPARLRAAGLMAEAEQFEGLVAITGESEWEAARDTIYAVRDAAWKRRSEAFKRLNAVAVAAAAADAVADAVAAAAAVAFKAKIEEATAAAVTARKNDESGYSAAYHVLRPYYEERYREVFASVGGLRESVLGLIDRLIEVGRA